MKGDLEPTQFDGRLLPTVVAIILVSLGALAWEWRMAHTSATKPSASMTPPDQPSKQDVRAARNSPPARQ